MVQHFGKLSETEQRHVRDGHVVRLYHCPAIKQSPLFVDLSIGYREPKETGGDRRTLTRCSVPCPLLPGLVFEKGEMLRKRLVGPEVFLVG